LVFSCSDFPEVKAQLQSLELVDADSDSGGYDISPRVLRGAGDEPTQSVSYQVLELPNPPAFPAGTYVFTSRDELNDAWTSAPQTDPGDLFSGTRMPVPNVDFSISSVVGVSLGVGTRCYIPQIVDVTAQGSNLLFRYRSNEPDGPTTLACLHQWPLAVFVKIPKLKGAIVFSRVTL